VHNPGVRIAHHSEVENLLTDPSVGMRHDGVPTSAAKFIAMGVIGGLLGGLAMNLFTRAVAATTGGHEARGVAPGLNRIGRGMQPPQAQGRADNDAAVRLGSATYRALTGREPDRALRLRLGATAHYGFSAAVGVCYMVLAQRVPSLRAGFGGLYGALVWAAADEGAMPALGLSRGPRALTPGLHVYSLFGHWVYGATLEAVRRAGTHKRELQSN
jgi:hypothetical protein